MRIVPKFYISLFLFLVTITIGCSNAPEVIMEVDTLDAPKTKMPGPPWGETESGSISEPVLPADARKEDEENLKKLRQ